MERMRADTVIATHGNTDFDAFASMLAARRLYPEAVGCLAGSLNRNVREFYRLHADELGLVEAARLELDAIRRLVVVETTARGPARRARAGRARPGRREGRLRPPRRRAARTGRPENTVVSRDGALTTTLVGILAERELAVTPLEATAFALGIHEDTGSLTYPTATQRDAEALAWCLRHGARQELLADFLHTPLARGGARAAQRAAGRASRPHELAGVEVLVAAAAWPSYVDGVSNLAHKIVDLTDCPGARAARRDGRARLRRRAQPNAGGRRRGDRAALGGGGHSAGGVGDLPGARSKRRGRAWSTGSERRPRAASRAATSCRAPRAPSAPDETVAHAMVACQRYGQSGILVDRGRPPRRLGRPRGSRQGDRPRPLARAGQGDHELARRHLPSEDDAARASSSACSPPATSGSRSCEGERSSASSRGATCSGRSGEQSAPPERPGPMLAEQLAASSGSSPSSTPSPR